MTDAASLQNLNDIVLPPAVALWPPAPGWYVVAAGLLMLLSWLGLRFWRGWRDNRYRRHALAEFSSLRGGRGDLLFELPGLLKRTALAVWPRESVASLTGEAWHRFLDHSAGIDRFRGGAGATLDLLAYTGQEHAQLQERDVVQLLDAAEYWLKHHNGPIRKR